MISEKRAELQIRGIGLMSEEKKYVITKTQVDAIRDLILLVDAEGAVPLDQTINSICSRPLEDDLEKTRKEFDKLRNQLQTRKKAFEENYPIGHDQRDSARCHIDEIDRTLVMLDEIESLRGETE